jgi:acyl-CoA dehydrogenase
MTSTEELTRWIESHCPKELPGSTFAYRGGSHQAISDPAFQSWFDACLERGFTVPDWPVEYGGAGFDKQQMAKLNEAFRKTGAPVPLIGGGKGMLGPMLLELGTDDQKSRHLLKIARGEVRWCQGYSEPGAGSDLASLQTRAVDNGDYYLVNGSKIWTSNAYESDWMFCLVRTNTEVAKQEGISFVLIAMDDPGLTVNQVDLINGSSEFCQVFFDDVKAYKNDLVGQENRGWSIAKRLLQIERSAVGDGSFIPRAGNLPEILEQYAPDDLAARDRVLQHQMQKAAYQLTQQRAAAEDKIPGAATFATSTFKYLSTRLESAGLDTTIALMGSQGMGWEGDNFTEHELEATREMLLSKGFLIAGGSSEVQLNIIAKRVLGLPD